MADIARSPWLNRDSPALNTYGSGLLVFNAITAVVLAAFSLFTKARHDKASRLAAADGRTLSKEQRDAHTQRLHRVDKTMYKLAMFDMANLIAITLADGWLCMKGLGNTIVVSHETTGWDYRVIMFYAAYIIFYFVVFTAAFTLFPMLQMILASRFLSRFSQRSDRHPLTHYLPMARGFSNAMSLTWTLCCLVVTLYWSPMSDNTIMRYIVLESVWGSALAWLEGAFAFNFRADRLGDKDPSFSDGRIQTLVSLFGETAVSNHSKEEKKSLLPLTETVGPAEKSEAV